MSQALRDFADSPAGQPLERSAAASASDRGQALTQVVAEVVGMSRVQLLRVRALPLSRLLFVQTDDAAPDSVRPTELTAQAERLFPSGLSFRHKTDFTIRRLRIEIAPPADPSEGRGQSFIATVVSSEPLADGTFLTTVRFLSTVDE